MKREMDERGAKTRAALALLDPGQRVAMEVSGGRGAGVHFFTMRGAEGRGVSEGSSATPFGIPTAGSRLPGTCAGPLLGRSNVPSRSDTTLNAPPSIPQGHRPGVYVRLRFSGMPCELVQHWDPRAPVLVGGLQQGEEGLGYMQLRLKRHRWFPKVLKNRDPLILSVGWRRFQSVPTFATKDNNGRHRMLKYSPEHMHCLATVWGPLAPPNTGVLAVQKLGGAQRGWRVSATGVVLQLDASINIVKKLKLVGTPFKVGVWGGVVVGGSCGGRLWGLRRGPASGVQSWGVLRARWLPWLGDDWRKGALK